MPGSSLGDMQNKSGRRQRLLFIVHDFSYLRNFYESLKVLQAQGFEVVLSVPSSVARDEDAYASRAIVRRGKFQIALCPHQRRDVWTWFADRLRRARVYAFFKGGGFAEATYLRMRAAERTPEDIREMVDRWVGPRTVRLAQRALGVLEAAVPPCEKARAFVLKVQPDVILVSPLMYQNTPYQYEFVKAARTMGIPVGVPVFSWDNLTNKGPIQIQPDALFVWNQTQVDEAVHLHRVSRRRIHVTGGMRFEQFFDAVPKLARDEFCAPLGFDPANPIITYLGSSWSIAPREPEYALSWLRALRGSSDVRLRNCNVYIRPHPSNVDVWEAMELDGFGPVALAPPAGNNVDGVVNAVGHSDAVVGINTTAMLEAAALGKPVLTVVDDRVRDGQEGTLHFHYMTDVAGGLLTVSRDFETHCRQLSSVFDGDAAFADKSRRYAAAFLRAPDPAKSSVDVFSGRVVDFVRNGKARLFVAWPGLLVRKLIVALGWDQEKPGT